MKHSNNRRKQGYCLSFILIGLLSLIVSQPDARMRPGLKAPAGQERLTISAAQPGQKSSRAAFDKLPLYFVENRGQLDSRVAYYVQGRDKLLYFTSQGLTFALAGREKPARASEEFWQKASLRPASFAEPEPPGLQAGWVLKLDFVGAKPDARPIGQDQTPAVISHFKGSQSQWQAGLKTYATLVYPDLWPGVDLVYSGTVNRLKYQFVVKPGADPNQIKLAYRGASAVRLNEAGQLELSTPAGSFSDDKPYAYQEVAGQRVEVRSAYVLEAKAHSEAQAYGFSVGDYDKSQPLVLDPAVLVYCGYVGGSGSDVGYSIALDQDRNAYITGSTGSTPATFPEAVGPYLTNSGTDAFVAKVNASGSALDYCGYIGGSSGDIGQGIAVDVNGEAYITGYTSSANFPVTAGALDATSNGCNWDAFVVRVNAAGTALVYSTYLGGTHSQGNCGNDRGTAIAVDNNGKAYVTGLTDTCAFPVKVGPDLIHGGPDVHGFPACFLTDAFVAKFDTNASGSASLIYSGYIGGSAYDFGYGIAIDAAGNAYVTGATGSVGPVDSLGRISFPVTPGAFDTTFNGGGYDAFVAKVKADGTGFVYVTYVGTSGDDQGLGVAVDSAGNAYITGSTPSANFPVTPGAFDTTHNGNLDTFVVKLNAAGTALDYATYLGGSGNDVGRGIALDSAGNTYITGSTQSSQATFPVLSGPDLTYTSQGTGTTAYVAKLNPTGTGLSYCGYIGDSSSDGRGIAVDSSGNAYVTGSTGINLPVIVGPDLSHNGGSDAFVAKISSTGGVGTNNPPDAVNDTASTPQGRAVTVTVLTNDIDPDGDSLVVDSVTHGSNGSVVINSSIYVTYTPNANFTGTDSFSYAISDGRGGSDMATVTVTVLAGGDGIADWNAGDGKFPEQACPAWELTDTAAQNPVFSAGKLRLSTSTNSEIMDYIQYEPDIAFPATPFIEARMRFVSGTSTTSVKTAAVIGFTTAPTVGNTLFIGQDEIFLLANASTRSATAFVDTNDAFHTYRIELGAGGTITVFYDGNQILTGATFADVNHNGNLRRIFWGDGTLTAAGTSDWEFVRHNAAECQPCVAAPTGTVSWWPWDGNANDIQGSNQATLFGSPAFTAGKVAQALQFDGVNDYAKANASASLDVGTGSGLTLEMWINPADIATGRPLLEWNNPAAAQPFGVHLWISSGGVLGSLFANLNDTAGNSHIIQTTTAVITANIYQHVALTYDKATGVATLYRNGVVVRQLNLGSFTPKTFTDLYFGLRPTNNTRFSGKLDEVSIYNRTLTALEIQAIVQASSSGKCQNQAPIATCQSVTVSADASCTANASIDNGSSDPDGDAITITQSPAGPYPIGQTNVTLTVTDSRGASSSCTATVTVVDATAPQITPPADVSYQCLSEVLPGHPSQATVSDNCGTPEITVADASNGGAGSPSSPLIITRVFMATDAAGNSNSATQKITVIDNTPPTITACATAQSALANNSCQAVVPNFTSGVTAADNCGGVSITQSPAAGTLVGLGATTVTLTVKDGAGNSSACTTTFTVTDNTPPTLTLPPAMSATTGASTTACGTVVTLPPPTGSDNCGGVTIMCTGVPSGNLFPVGTTTITCTATDGSGNTVSATQTITVIDNTAPAITAPPAVQVSTNTGSCTATGVSLGTPTTSDNCAVAVVTNNAPSSFPLGTTTVTWTVTDVNGNTATATQTVTVTDNQKPALNAPPAVNVSTGIGATACGVVISDTMLGSATASDNCGNVTITRSGVPAGNFFPVGTTMITYTATDQAGNTTTATQPVNVIDNTAPVIACPASLSVAGNILGACAANVNVGAATASDNCGTPTVTGTRSDGQALNASYPLGMTTITWRATDAAGNQATCQQTVTITNPAPLPTISGPPTGALYAVNTPVTFSGGFSDNAGGTHTATWAFDSFTSTGTVNEATGAISGSFTFTTAGVYKVTLTITDGCGGTGTVEQVEGLTALIVIYDPNGGWVTGGGWINSPAGAYAANPSLTGKANFGFVSKYHNGATLPSGNTEFQFKAGNLNFSSTSYEWLVVAGARAQYKGAGTINGAGDYRFMLTAIDGQVNGGGGVDKFRLKIWDKLNGDAIVYDNQMGAGDDSNPTTVLGGGSIVIHK
jgi:hypothetical protein